MPTIHDVAREAGVSAATVSRVLNDSGLVREETRQLVHDTIARLGYRPNLMGRSLRLQQTNMVLVFISTMVNSFYAKVIKGIEDVAEQNGYHILICTTYFDKKREEQYLDMLINHLVDGAVFLAASMSAEEISQLGEDNAIILCNEMVEGCNNVPFVSIDNEQAGYDATRHLLNCGARQILLLTAEEQIASSRARQQGYQRALAEAGIPFDKKQMLHGNFGYRNAKRIVEQHIQEGQRFDGVFALSDRMAAGAVSACLENGLRVPEDVRVVGFDNVDISYMANPALTTVSQSQYDMGAAAMELLIRRMHGQQVEKHITIPHELIVRQSG